jgi:hypothetical protein
LFDIQYSFFKQAKLHRLNDKLINVLWERHLAAIDGSRKIPRNRHAGLDPASRTFRIYWIPAFTGMTGKQKN